jgi:hypothetical protein
MKYRMRSNSKDANLKKKEGMMVINEFYLFPNKK